MSDRYWEALAVVVALSGASPVSCSAGGVPVTLNEAIFRNEPGESRVSAGSGCMSARLPAAYGGDSQPVHGGDFSHSEATDGDAFLIQVFSDTELLATRRYDVTMLRSGHIDEFSVVTHSGTTYTLQYWGGPCVVTLDESPGD
jgi:hypothetical protein